MSIQELKGMEVRDEDDVTIVTLTTEKILDEQYTDMLGERLFDLVENQGKRKMIIQLAQVVYLGTAAIGKLLTLNKLLLKKKGKQLVLCGMIKTIYEVFEITKFNKLFTFEQDEEKALTGLR